MDLPINNGDFSIVTLVYQRVTPCLIYGQRLWPQDLRKTWRQIELHRSQDFFHLATLKRLLTCAGSGLAVASLLVSRPKKGYVISGNMSEIAVNIQHIIGKTHLFWF